MRLPLAAAVVAALAIPVLAGCLGDEPSAAPVQEATPPPLAPVQERRLLDYKVDGFYSYTLAEGAFEILPGLRVDVPVELPVTEGGNAITGDASMNLGLFLPDIPGCDWKARELPDFCKVPVVADAGPYYSATTGIPGAQTEGDTISTEPARRLGGFLIDNLVPHGYAVAQVSVFGTGDSNHCMDLMGDAEQAGIDAAVTWLGTQPWSNGRVALIGRSYDGTTPWEAAMFGNPYLASIVPISGLTSQFDLMYHNGSAEARGAGLLYGLYAAMTIDGEAQDGQQALCPDYLTGSAEGLKATLAGNPTDADPYWAERIFLDRALANYDGSIYLIHGLQDWNVEPHMAFPAYNQFEAKGNEVKALLGQWGHMYPDRPGEHAGLGRGRGGEAFPESVRYDWAQDLLEWFDYTLKQTGAKPAMQVEVQDNLGQWRIEPTWPPASTRLDVGIAEEQMAAGEEPILRADTTLHFDLGPLSETEDVRFAGLPHLEQWVTPTGPGGQIYAQLVDLDAKGGPLHLGHAIMELRFASGGRAPEPVVPGMPMKVRLEFEPLDVVLPAGHRLGLEYAVLGEDYVAPTVANPLLLGFGEGQAADNRLELPIVAPAASQFFSPPAWSGDAERAPAQP